MHPLRLASIVLASGLWTGCTSAPLQPARKSSEPSETSGDLSAVKMPVLRSAYFEKQWGAPDITISGDGGYRMRFRQGTTLNFVVIHGLTGSKPAPATPPDWHEEGMGQPTPPHKQGWQTAVIVGKPVKWYQEDGGSGADFPSYATVDFSLTAPDGRTGNYRIVVNSDSKKKATDWIHRVNW